MGQAQGAVDGLLGRPGSISKKDEIEGRKERKKRWFWLEGITLGRWFFLLYNLELLWLGTALL